MQRFSTGRPRSEGSDIPAREVARRTVRRPADDERMRQGDMYAARGNSVKTLTPGRFDGRLLSAATVNESGYPSCLASIARRKMRTLNTGTPHSLAASLSMDSV